LTKNLFLYINSNKNLAICSSNKDVYCFGDKLVGIDKNIYDRRNRFMLQKKFNVHPYFVSQNVFKEILYSLSCGNSDIKLLDITFLDDSIIETVEYEYLQQIILGNDMANLYKEIMSIIKEFDTEIKSVKFLYNCMKMELTNEGVLNFYSNDELLNGIVSDMKIKNLLLGRC